MNLQIFNTANLFEAATNLFQQLNIKLNSNTAEPLPTKDILKHHYKNNDTFKNIDKTYFIGIIDDSVFKATGMFNISYSYNDAIEQGDKNYKGLMLFALELKKQPTRTEISELTRAFNRISQKMPVALVLKYTVAKEAVFSIAISERFKYLQNWRQGEKAGKVIILRDIHTQNTHAGHIRILQDLVKPVGVNTYEQLHQHWLQVLDVSILNKKFFQELSNWYFSALNEVSFPDDLEKNKEIRNATNLIRLITRVIFIWFIKEKQLVPASLFRKNFVAGILKDFSKNEKSHNYYNAILQNLFFATLNQKMEERKFAKEGNITTNKVEYGVKNLFRYADLFTIPEKEVLALFKDVPFLNGGLFDCLDKPNDEGKIEYVDGFSRNPKKKAIVPDYLFFSEEKEVDLNDVYGTKNKRYSSRGLINLLESYKFTVAENTPIEEEIALDPELLGKVFENLLASYNPETQTTARKQTGSFYTPREIVNYMVDESLLEYLKQNVKNESKDFEAKLRDVFSYSENPNPFNETETKALIEAINNCKILDPACGSGAFPMGILHKMVHILQKLDPENKYWKCLQRKKAIEQTKAAFNIGDKEERARRLAEINDVFENNASDYGRKLFLIENCIYGIDIQPIAVQIAKLRFFISLVIDQKVDKSKENFGVRSLPNLETKFVAANTLIGLDKPHNLFYTETIIKLEERIKHIRHKYFLSTTRNEKLKYQKEDKQLRLNLSTELKNIGLSEESSNRIAQFDIFDQNHFANWFDPEWMFGVTDGFDIVIGNPPYIQLQKDGGKLAKLYEKQHYQTFARKGDIYTLFYEKGMQLLKQNGILSFITSNKWMRAGYGEKTRLFFTQYNPLLLIDLGPGVFESATVDTNILLIQKANNNNQLLAVTLQKEDNNTDIAKQLKERGVILNKLSKDAWFIGSSAEQALKEKIEKIGKPLEEWDVKIYRGVLTGLNEAFIIDSKKRDEILANCKDAEERKRTEAIIKPILRGRDIKRYSYEWAGLWVIVIPAGWTDENRGKIQAEKFIENTFPSLMKHLKQFEQKAKKRDDQGDYWWELRKCAYYPEFEKEKIIYIEIMTDNWEEGFPFPSFSYWSDAGIVLNTAYIMTGNNLNYILGILNSRFGKYIVKQHVTQLQKRQFRMLAQYVNKFEIPNISHENQPIVTQIEALVDKILQAKKSNPQADTSNWEREIDKLVYSLYDLTEEEIRIVEK